MGQDCDGCGLALKCAIELNTEVVEYTVDIVL